MPHNKYNVSFEQSRIDDGRWHKIRILRKRRVGILQVDNTEEPVKIRSPKGATILNTDGVIWIGKLHQQRKHIGENELNFKDPAVSYALRNFLLP